MSKKQVFFTGLMLFSLFFGAGNLIFPPLLGLESGNHFTPAIIGFLLTGVLLPFMAVLAVATVDGGLISIGSRVGKVFGIVFASIIYLSIGAFYGIPRAASVAYELGFQQFYQSDHRLTLILFSILFFSVTFFICLNPKKIVQRVGEILTPLLLITLAILFVRAFFLFENTQAPIAEKYSTTPFVTGILEGYFTMDAVAALAFGIVVVNALKDSGIRTRKEQVKGTLGAGLIAGIGLAIVYVSLGRIGVVMPKETEFLNGADILTTASQILFGSTGSLLFSTIVLLACLTTCVGLINASASFFQGLYPKFSYKFYVGVLSVIGFSVSSLGLNMILDIAVPMLMFIYPVAIVLVALSLLQPLIGNGKMMYRFTVTFTFLYAMYEVLKSLGLNVDGIAQIIGFVPFFNLGLGWVIPALVGGIIGFLMDKFVGKEQVIIPVQGKN